MNRCHIGAVPVYLAIHAVAVSLAVSAAFADARAADDDRGTLAGAWVLNRELSDDASKVMDDLRAQRTRGGRRGGGGMRIGGGMAEGMAGGHRRDGPEQMRELRELMQELTDPPPTLTITQGAAHVTFTERDGRTTTFATDAKKEKHVFGTREIETKTRWKGRQLVKEMALGDGLKASETYAIAEYGSRLEVPMKIQGGRMPRALTLRRVYDAAMDVTGP